MAAGMFKSLICFAPKKILAWSGESTWSSQNIQKNVQMRKTMKTLPIMNKPKQPNQTKKGRNTRNKKQGPTTSNKKTKEPPKREKREKREGGTTRGISSSPNLPPVVRSISSKGKENQNERGGRVTKAVLIRNDNATKKKEEDLQPADFLFLYSSLVYGSIKRVLLKCFQRVQAATILHLPVVTVGEASSELGVFPSFLSISLHNLLRATGDEFRS